MMGRQRKWRFAPAAWRVSMAAVAACTALCAFASTTELARPVFMRDGAFGPASTIPAMYSAPGAWIVVGTGLLVLALTISSLGRRPFITGMLGVLALSSWLLFGRTFSLSGTDARLWVGYFPLRTTCRMDVARGVERHEYEKISVQSNAPWFVDIEVGPNRHRVFAGPLAGRVSCELDPWEGCDESRNPPPSGGQR